MDHHALPRAVAVPLLAGPLLLLPVPARETPPPSHPPSAPGAVAGTTPHGAGEDARSSPAAPPWRWPVDPRPRVLRGFVAPASPWGPGHRGLDLAAAVGAEVVAVDDGVVTHAGRVAGRGTVTVTHPGGLASTYEPVRAGVLPGTTVGAGSALGVLEAPGSPPAGGHCLLAPCLHLGARRGRTYVDPMLLLSASRVRLLPLDPVSRGPGRGSGHTPRGGASGAP